MFSYSKNLIIVFLLVFVLVINSDFIIINSDFITHKLSYPYYCINGQFTSMHVSIPIS